MNVYHVRSDIEQYKFFTTPKKFDLEQLFDAPFDRKLGSTWKGLTVYNRNPESEDYPGDLPAGDFVGITANEIGVTPKALAVVGNALRSCGELLPVGCPDHPEPLLWFHPTAVVDALDVARSEAKPLLASGRLFVTRHSFFTNRLQDVTIFCVPEDPAPKFCTDTFKSLVQKNGLTGLDFMLAWSDEPAGIARLEKRYAPKPRP